MVVRFSGGWSNWSATATPHIPLGASLSRPRSRGPRRNTSEHAPPTNATPRSEAKLATHCAATADIRRELVADLDPAGEWFEPLRDAVEWAADGPGSDDLVSRGNLREREFAAKLQARLISYRAHFDGGLVFTRGVSIAIRRRNASSDIVRWLRPDGVGIHEWLAASLVPARPSSFVADNS